MTSIKLNKIFLKEVEDGIIKNTMKSKIDIKNCLVIFHSSNIFELSTSTKVSMSLIERCFSMIVDSNNCFELDFISIKKILSSSGLNIDSELQVFNAADSWLCHGITERSKYAKDLLSMVRLPLLSIPALKEVLDRVSLNYPECSQIFESVLVKKQQLNSTTFNITSRYCNQTNFNIFVCGGKNVNLKKVSNGVEILNAKSFSTTHELPHMNKTRCRFGAVCIKGEVYVFGGYDKNYKTLRSVEKYSPATNTWEHVAHMMDDRKFFSYCSFMDDVYIMGGYKCNGANITATCFEFNTKSLKWKEVSSMNDRRKQSASSVFEGRIIVSGGYNNGSLNTVEAYDHVGDTWENMANMVKERFGHKSVAVKNKLFVIGGFVKSDCEVFDSTTNKFTLLKQPTVAPKYFLRQPSGAFTFGSKIFVLRNEGSVIIYDFENDEWSEKTCKATTGIWHFSCAKLPVKTC